MCMSTFTDKLEACYQAQHYDRTNFAKAIGVPESTIRNWIRNNSIPPADILYKIAKFFGVPMEYFMDGGEISFSDKEINLLIKMKHLSADQLDMISFIIEKFENENYEKSKEPY